MCLRFYIFPSLTCTFWFLTCSTTSFLSLLFFAFQTRQRYWTYIWLGFHQDWFHFYKGYVIFHCSAVVLRMNNFLFYGALHMWIPEAKNSATIFSRSILTLHQYWTNHAPQISACSQCFLLHFSFYTDSRSLNRILHHNFLLLGHQDSCRNNATRSRPICLI